mmetsp:Transcript_20625/g.35571  ORF Transcript_20625/g.35571 Transcript_20625/m.35571 type:complete len:276 (+) Transcript_20625:164-991(+)
MELVGLHMMVGSKSPQRTNIHSDQNNQNQNHSNQNITNNNMQYTQQPHPGVMFPTQAFQPQYNMYPPRYMQPSIHTMQQTQLSMDEMQACLGLSAMAAPNSNLFVHNQNHMQNQNQYQNQYQNQHHQQHQQQISMPPALPLLPFMRPPFPEARQMPMTMTMTMQMPMPIPKGTAMPMQYQLAPLTSSSTTSSASESKLSSFPWIQKAASSVSLIQSEHSLGVSPSPSPNPNPNANANANVYAYANADTHVCAYGGSCATIIPAETSSAHTVIKGS